MRGMLYGKVAVVTGAGRGLGRSHALALAAQGAHVVVNDLGGDSEGGGADAAPAQQVVEQIVTAGGRAIISGANVADWEEARGLIHAAVDAFGGLDIVVNNAGISRFAPIGVMEPAIWDRTIAVNLTGTAAVSHWAARFWREQGPATGRAIVNTASPAGTNPQPDSPAYCASKAGVLALTITSAAELAHLGVRVNAIAPMARTRMTEAVEFLADILRKPESGFDRIAPEHVSPLVLYLASPDCRFTGRTFGIEGDDIYLFEGFSAEHHANNARQQWTVPAIAAALADLPLQDIGYMIAPGLRVPAAQPSDATIAALSAG